MAAIMFCTLVTPLDVPAPVAGFAAAAAAVLPDPLGLFASRSEGARPAGALATSKPERVAPGERRRAGPPVGPPGPHERVLPQIRTRPPADGGGIPGTGDMPLFVPDLPMTGLTPMGGFTGLPPESPGMIVPPLSPAVPTEVLLLPPAPPGPPPAPVPEPATWITLLLGFGGLGTWLRMRRRTGASRPLRR